MWILPEPLLNLLMITEAFVTCDEQRSIATALDELKTDLIPLGAACLPHIHEDVAAEEFQKSEGRIDA